MNCPKCAQDGKIKTMDAIDGDCDGERYYSTTYECKLCNEIISIIKEL